MTQDISPVTTPFPSLSPQDALVAIMVTVSFSDETVRTAELMAIDRQVGHLPVFASYDPDRIRVVAQAVLALLEEEDGLDALFGLVRDALPERLYETAYAMACDVAAADGSLGQPELRMLEETRHELNIDRLHAAAIERGARARHLTV
jgi:tellurite resistance protein